MLLPSKRLLYLVLVGLVTLGGPGLSIALGQGGQTNPPSRAMFRSLPQDTQDYPTNTYMPYYPTYPAYSIGSTAADAIRADGEFGIMEQQMFLEREKVFRSRIQTRKAHVDEYLYERNVLPTLEDDRERDRIENLRRSRNDPPLTEIWSGKALNDLLLALQQQSVGAAVPPVPLDEDVVRHLNVSSGAGQGSVGALGDGGRLTWPLALRGDAYASERQRLSELSYKAYKQAEKGPVDASTLQDMGDAVDKLQSELKRNVAEITPNDYIRAKRFLNDVESAIQALQDPKVSNYLTGKWVAKGKTVAELVGHLTREGLKFAPASEGDQPAYLATHRAMVASLATPDPAKPWDPFAK
jgi:hypothetical protein